MCGMDHCYCEDTFRNKLTNKLTTELPTNFDTCSFIVNPYSARYLERRPELVKNKTILELGSGCE